MNGRFRLSLNIKEAKTVSQILENIFLFRSGEKESIPGDEGWLITIERQGKSVIIEGRERTEEDWQLIGALATADVYALALALQHVGTEFQKYLETIDGAPHVGTTKCIPGALRLVVDNRIYSP